MLQSLRTEDISIISVGVRAETYYQPPLDKWWNTHPDKSPIKSWKYRDKQYHLGSCLRWIYNCQLTFSPNACVWVNEEARILQKVHANSTEKSPLLRFKAKLCYCEATVLTTTARKHCELPHRLRLSNKCFVVFLVRPNNLNNSGACLLHAPLIKLFFTHENAVE